MKRKGIFLKLLSSRRGGSVCDRRIRLKALRDDKGTKHMMTIQRIIDFAEHERGRHWTIVNDGVMGGVSTSDLRVAEDGYGEFSGVLSLENSGGFASTRTHIPIGALAGCDGIVVRVQGDGKIYRLRLRTNDVSDGIAYQQEFHAPTGAWQEIILPLDRFFASYRGQPLPDAGPVDASRVEQIGFLIANRQSGPFKLRIAWIATYQETERMRRQAAV